MSDATLAFHNLILPSGHSAHWLCTGTMGEQESAVLGCQDRAPSAGGVWMWHSWALWPGALLNSVQAVCDKRVPLPAWTPCPCQGPSLPAVPLWGL